MPLHPQGDQSLITNVLAPSGVGTRKNLLELSRERRLKYSVYFFLAWLRKCPRFAARWASNMVSAIFDHGSGAMATAISYRNIGILL